MNRVKPEHSWPIEKRLEKVENKQEEIQENLLQIMEKVVRLESYHDSRR